MFKILSLHAEIEILNLLHIILTRAGYDHFSTTDPEIALALLSQGQIDLFIQNLMRPGTNGCEFYRLMQNDKKLRDVQVLIVSSLNPVYIPEEYFELMQPLYPNNYLITPFSPRVLLTTVEKILADAPPRT